MRSSVLHCYFNPRSREGSDALSILRPTTHLISIHAPARGATLSVPSGRISIVISIHAPARGATPCVILLISLSAFQSTLPRGERPQPWSLHYTYLISIHAPARGATFFQGSHFRNVRYFNPRSREGSDEISTPSFLRSLDFNPRSREGSDIFFLFHHLSILHFNPRSREGSDDIAYDLPASRPDFNPRSREGSDVQSEILYDHGWDFNPRSREGSDAKRLIRSFAESTISIHAPARGATVRQKYPMQKFRISIHAPARGATITFI